MITFASLEEPNTWPWWLKRRCSLKWCLWSVSSFCKLHISQSSLSCFFTGVPLVQFVLFFNIAGQSGWSLKTGSIHWTQSQVSRDIRLHTWQTCLFIRRGGLTFSQQGKIHSAASAQYQELSNILCSTYRVVFTSVIWIWPSHRCFVFGLGLGLVLMWLNNAYINVRIEASLCQCTCVAPCPLPHQWRFVHACQYAVSSILYTPTYKWCFILNYKTKARWKTIRLQ